MTRRNKGAMIVAGICLLMCTGCLSERDLRIECETDEDCGARATCEFLVCIPIDPSIPVLDCGAGLVQCGTECVDVRRDMNHCGGCFDVCEAGPQQEAVCAANACVQTCSDNFWDLDPDEPGCEYACTRTSPSVETCDRVDNNCDGLVDGEDPTIVTPACENTEGVCVNARRPCVEGQLLACDDSDYARFGDGLYEAPVEVSCDGIDNNCDSNVDEHCCRAADAQYDLRNDGGERSVAGFWRAGGELRLAVINTDSDSVEVYVVDPFEGQEIIETWDDVRCDGTLVDAHYVPAARAMVVACNAGGAAIGTYDVRDDRFAVDLETSSLEAATQVTAHLSRGAFATIVQTVDLSDQWHTRIISQGDIETYSAEFAPDGKARRTVALAHMNDELLVAYPVRTDGVVWLQTLNRELEPLGDPEVIVPDLVWETSAPNAIAGLGVDSTTAVFAISENPNTLRVFRWDHAARSATEIATFEAANVQRITLQAVDDQLLIGAVVESGLAAWEIGLNGTLNHEWRFRVGNVHRASNDRALPARFSIVSQHGVLYIAYASPIDAAGDPSGLLLHRLGGDAAPLCR